MRFLSTEKGREALSLMHRAEIIKGLIEQSKKDVEKGISSGKTTYSATAYTDANIDYLSQYMVNDGSARNEKYYTKAYEVARDLSSLNDKELYTKYINYFGGFTYDMALGTKDASKLTSALYSRLLDKHADDKKRLREISKLKKEDAIRKALESGDLTQSDVIDTLLSGDMEPGWGLSASKRNLIQSAVREEKRLAEAKLSASYNAVGRAVATQNAKSILSKANADSKVTATVSGFDETKGVATVHIDLTGKGIEAQSIDVPVSTEGAEVSVGTSVDVSGLIRAGLTNQGV